MTPGTDAVMKVSVDVLHRVYDLLQNLSDNANPAEHDFLDPESHLSVIDAFGMPLWHWSAERSTFEQ
jgi:DNA polymerase epsilon subunit 2